DHRALPGTHRPPRWVACWRPRFPPLGAPTDPRRRLNREYPRIVVVTTTARISRAEEDEIMTAAGTLSAATDVSAVTLNVANLDRVLAFYHLGVGLDVLEQDGGTVSLGRK